MTIAVVTGSAGLVGSEAAEHFAAVGLDVVGIDNDMRRSFFGAEASTEWRRHQLERQLGSHYRHVDLDIRDREGLDALFAQYGAAIGLVIHAAAQPSHDWAAKEPHVDFEINALGTLHLLEATRRNSPEAAFIFCSTNKVYGDTPNSLPFVELPTRYELPDGHPYEGGIREDMSTDQCLHSVFGASKLAADVMVQEYGRYFGLRTACFRGGTLTGPQHSATELHGFLGYVMRCAMTGTTYTVHGYKGKQVRDALHSQDLVNAFDAVFRDPKPAAVYNIGGGRRSNASVLEALALAEKIVGTETDWTYNDANRVGDHVWWVSDNGRFQADYPAWEVEYDVPRIMEEIHEANVGRWTRPS
jgi:CDP-paratose 2-epimerase